MDNELTDGQWLNGWFSTEKTVNEQMLPIELESDFKILSELLLSRHSSQTCTKQENKSKGPIKKQIM